MREAAESGSRDHVTCVIACLFNLINGKEALSRSGCGLHRRPKGRRMLRRRMLSGESGSSCSSPCSVQLVVGRGSRYCVICDRRQQKKVKKTPDEFQFPPPAFGVLPNDMLGSREKTTYHRQRDGRQRVAAEGWGMRGGRMLPSQPLPVDNFAQIQPLLALLPDSGGCD